MTFIAPYMEGRALDLEEAIDWFYAVYADAPPASLAIRRVDEVMEILRAEGI